MNPKRTVVIGLVLIVILGLAGATALVVRAYRAPLGPALQSSLATTPPMEDPLFVTAIPPENLAAATDLSADPPADPNPVPVAAQAEVCGETSAWNVLVLGSDAGDLRGIKGSDLTRMLRVDFPNRRVAMFTFPRDLWVDTTGLGLTNPTINNTRLGMVFYEARTRSTSTSVQMAMVAGTNATARMLATNFLVSTDHYLTIDLTQIPAMVDAIGGVPVNIPATITDPWIGTTIQAGQQTLNGAQFVAYARVIPDSDFDRIQRDTLLLSALQQKLLDPAVWVRIPQLYEQFKDVVATDLSPEQINHLSCLLQEVPQESIIQESVRQEWTTPGPQAGSLLWDKTLTYNRMRELGLVP